ncbi:Mlp family lipoprotein [Borrelia hermsii]|uniref:Mlp lipoprotein family protein n=1 Tax=Borrelia hermsii MTW TaxID=1313291 RepID=W5T671_BORHE|nr:Mlp family lipoprotein [Borrelia hermsii]AHH14443.1 Mlp lipoprotein family protein [Borrelia hermsii MTW]
MKVINFVLIILLLIISNCGQYNNKDKGIKSRSKRDDLREQAQEVQKTPEEALREKLNDIEKSNLNFLKDALGDENKFNQFVLLNQSKIKDALEHIKSELSKCSGNEQGKNTFKEVVKGYFNTMNDNTLNGFKSGAISTCGAGSG